MSFLSHLGGNAPLHLLLAIAVCGAFVSCTTPEPAWRHWTAPSAIRTLDILSERHIRYAAAKGWVGETTDAGIQWNEQRWMAPDSTFPSFRASGWNGKAWFVASIASPGWIGRCTDLNTVPEWVHQDTNETVFFDAMAWWNPEEGLVFGDPVSGCLTLLVTRDGGNTWRAADCENVPPHEPGEAGFAASNGNIALSGDTAWVFTGGKASRCLRSTDRGTSWEAFPLPIVQGEAMTGAFSGTFSSAQQGWVMGGNWEDPNNNRGNLAETHDGGETWTLIAEGTGPGYRSSIVHHPTFSDQLVAVGFLGIDVSLDRGRTWHHVSDSSRYVARFSPSGNALWLAGRHGLSKANWTSLVNDLQVNDPAPAIGTGKST